MKKPLTTTLLLILVCVCMVFGLTVCGIFNDKCEHTYDNACDTTCNKCDAERSITHTPNNDDGDCTTEITCSVCKSITTPAKDSHTGGIATCTAKAECTECGTAYGTVDGNNHIDENTDHICDRKCGKTDIGTHADSAEDNDHVCDYGCGEILSNHEGGDGTATCEHGKICDVCGEYYGDPLPHNYTYTADDEADTITESCDQGCGHSATITLGEPTDLAYSGSKKEAPVEGTLKNATPKVTYNAEPINAGKYTATLTAGNKSVSVEFTIEKATITPTVSVSGWTYGQDANAPTVGGNHGNASVTYEYKIEGADDSTYTTTVPANAGNYTVRVTVAESDNYLGETATADFTIEKATFNYTVPTGLTATYGDTLANVTLPNVAEGEWTWQDADTTSVGNNGTNTFKVTFTPNDTTNYKATTDIEVTVTVKAKVLTEDDVTVGNLNDSYVYTGEQITPEITVTVDGKTLTKGIDYEVTYGENKYGYAAEDDGTVTIIFKGNYIYYEGTITKTFEITRDPNTKEFDGEWVTIPEE